MPFREPTPNLEKRENLPNAIAIYAKDIMIISKDSITRQGFGISQKLTSPETTIVYVWEGKLHPTQRESAQKQGIEDYSSSSYSNKSLNQLAQNLASNLFQRRNSALARENKPSYKLEFTPPSKDPITEEGITIRGLSPEEEKMFLQYYREEYRRLRQENPDPETKSLEKLYGKVPKKDPVHDPDGHYDMLGINPRELGGLDDQQIEKLIKSNYYRMAIKHHPDRGGTRTGFIPIQEAYEFLMDKKKRDSYGLSVP